MKSGTGIRTEHGAIRLVNKATGSLIPHHRKTSHCLTVISFRVGATLLTRLTATNTHDWTMVILKAFGRVTLTLIIILPMRAMHSTGNGWSLNFPRSKTLMQCDYCGVNLSQPLITF